MEARAEMEMCASRGSSGKNKYLKSGIVHYYLPRSIKSNLLNNCDLLYLSIEIFRDIIAFQCANPKK